MTVAAAFAAVLAITFAVPMVVYGAASRFADLQTPSALSPWGFLATVAVEKAGVALVFVGALALAALAATAILGA